MKHKYLSKILRRLPVGETLLLERVSSGQLVVSRIRQEDGNTFAASSCSFKNVEAVALAVATPPLSDLEELDYVARAEERLEAWLELQNVAPSHEVIARKRLSFALQVFNESK